MQHSVIHSEISGRDITAIKDFDPSNYQALRKIGINFPASVLDEMHASHAKRRSAMDSLQPTVTTASITTPVQFLQEWMPGLIHVITAARKIDEVIGIQTIGSWEDEQVVQGIIELTGVAQPYGDYTNVPEASWNANWVPRTVVRFEQGMLISNLEEARAARVNIDTAASKRNACGMQLEIVRNRIGFFGFNAGSNNTYGFLNDPGLPNYVTAAVGASTFTTWSTKTFLEICNDIRTMIQTLRSQSQDQIDPEGMPLTLALATAVVDYLSVVSDFGISVRDWMSQAYPKIRVVSAPELTAANGGANVGYLFADAINDSSTDGGRTWVQPVPAKFLVLGVEKLPKGFLEDYSNATAGAFLKRPWAVTRITGI
jgi:hypothetical protein